MRLTGLGKTKLCHMLCTDAYRRLSYGRCTGDGDRCWPDLYPFLRNPDRAPKDRSFAIATTYHPYSVKGNTRHWYRTLFLLHPLDVWLLGLHFIEFTCALEDRVLQMQNAGQPFPIQRTPNLQLQHTPLSCSISTLIFSYR